MLKAQNCEETKKKADLLIEKSQYKKAIPSLISYLKKDSTCVPIYLDLFTCYFWTNNYHAALNVITKAKSILPVEPQVYDFSAKVYAVLDSNIQALKEIDQGISQYPTCARLYGRKADIYESMEKQDEALRTYNKAIELDPSNFEYYFNRGSVRCSLNDIEGGFKDFKYIINNCKSESLVRSTKNRMSDIEKYEKINKK